jgi:hypothetical protein
MGNVWAYSGRKGDTSQSLRFDAVYWFQFGPVVSNWGFDLISVLKNDRSIHSPCLFKLIMSVLVLLFSYYGISVNTSNW